MINLDGQDSTHEKNYYVAQVSVSVPDGAAPLEAYVQVLDASMGVVASQLLSIPPSSGWTVSFEVGVLGRYVRIWSSSPGALKLSEVAVAGVVDLRSPSNLAMGPNAVATQSSTCAYGSDSDGVASRAVDGVTDGGPGQYTYTCNVEGEYPWVSLCPIRLYNQRCTLSRVVNQHALLLIFTPCSLSITRLSGWSTSTRSRKFLKPLGVSPFTIAAMDTFHRSPTRSYKSWTAT